LEDKTTAIFLKVREGFPGIKEKVSLIKPYVELMVFSKCWVLKSGEFERILGFKPEHLYRSSENIYAISMLYNIDDDITAGIIAEQFASIAATEKDIQDQKLIDAMCVRQGFGKELLSALQNELFTDSEDICFSGAGGLGNRINHIKKLLGEAGED